MNYYQWTIGSTTVRNPNRLREGLQVLKDNFEGQAWNLKQQERFFTLLKEKDIYGIGDYDYEKMTSARKQEHARKWVSVLNQLGFCYAYQSSDKPVVISKAGEALLNNPEIEEEIFLRQLLKYQKPCILPKQNGKAFESVSILPFIASLKIIYFLNGLSKEEISIFLNTTIRREDIDSVINDIKIYRIKKSKIKGRVKHRKLYFRTQWAHLKEVFKAEITERNILIKQLIAEFKKAGKFISTKNGKNLLSEITKGGKGSNTVKAKQTERAIIDALKKGYKSIAIKEIFLNYYLPLKISTLKDYADLTARYLRKSGLFSIQREKIIIISEKEDLIKSLLSQQWKLVDDKEYLSYLWSDVLPTLPSDNVGYLESHLKLISKKEQVLFNKMRVEKSVELVGKKLEEAKSVLELKQKVNAVSTNLLRLKELEFYRYQNDDKQIEDILNYYDLIRDKEILGGVAYYPAYLEWNTWRVFLAINTLFNKPFEARNFRVDDELQPIDHAPGNRADMVFEYDDFILVTEVTLSVRANQWSAEAEPVPRHVAKVQFDNKGKQTFGLFIAPEIDINTVLTFFNNRKHSINGKIINLTIIPFTIAQIKLLLSIFRIKRFSIKDMRELFEKIQSQTNKSKNAIKCFNEIPKLLKDWSQNL